MSTAANKAAVKGAAQLLSAFAVVFLLIWGLAVEWGYQKNCKSNCSKFSFFVYDGKTFLEKFIQGFTTFLLIITILAWLLYLMY